MLKKTDIIKNVDLEEATDVQSMDGGAVSPLHKEFDTRDDAITYMLKVKKVISGVYLEVLKNKYVITCGVCSKPKSDKILQILKSAGIG